uniref:Nucleotidyltransferase substrate binding protein, HI0074 family n=2 Tax=unclassified Candidatus Kentrum TaxID=2643149 RepID=A0A451AVD3_9GAMM|nr:MAG: nucleotidyltransferase substrate binding protein, HI0074 family [Candidatus Kentron sp. UNK]VFK69982.1 MAG: nucleotidyltransferase substrate binding protein, HI0074 family [Candidatus Kentron sp. UNK]
MISVGKAKSIFVKIDPFAKSSGKISDSSTMDDKEPTLEPFGEDVRWKQRFDNYRRALAQLADGVALERQRPLSRLEQQGLIKAFEFTHELAWNVMKDYFTYQGNTDITGSRDAIRAAFRHGLIADGESWMTTIASRNRSSHAYDEETANHLADRITTHYLALFERFARRMEELDNA